MTGFNTVAILQCDTVSHRKRKKLKKTERWYRYDVRDVITLHDLHVAVNIALESSVVKIKIINMVHGEQTQHVESSVMTWFTVNGLSSFEQYRTIDR